MNDSIRETLRINLSNYIEKSGITQKALAEQLGVSKGAITNWINGSNSPNIEILAKVCQILNVKMSDMLSDKTEFTFIEKQIIKKYRSLDTFGQRAVNSIIDVEYERCSNEGENTVIIAEAARTSDNRKSLTTREATEKELEIFYTAPQSDEKL